MEVILAASLGMLTPERPSDVPPPCSHPFIIYFDSGSAAISEGGQAILDFFGVPYVQSSLTSNVKVYAGTDSVGSPATNLRLSRSRGEAIRDYLARLGVPEHRIGIVAQGEEQPMVPTPDETPNEHNRTVKVVEEVTDAEMARRKAAWAAFPNVVC